MALVMPPTQYWIFNGRAQGPFALPQIQAKLANGEVTWGTKICPVGQTQWRPLHRTPGIVPDAQRPLGSLPVKMSPGPVVGTTPRPVPLLPRPPRTSRLTRRALFGVGAAAMLVAGYYAVPAAFTHSFDGYERGYGDTILRYIDRPYDGAKWTQLKETSSFAEMVSLGRTPVTELTCVTGWDDSNLWVANQLGQVFQLRDGHWQFAAKPDNADYPRLRAVDQSTLLVAGGNHSSHLYRLSPGNVADIGQVYPMVNGEIFPADNGVVFAYSARQPSEPIQFADGDRKVLKADLFKEAFVQRDDSTALKEYFVGAIRHVRPILPGVAYGIASPNYGNDKKKLVRYENGVWTESTDLPDKDAKDLWLNGSSDAPHLVLIGKNGWVYVQPATGIGTERSLAIPADTSQMNLLKVWGTSPDKFWVMDEHGTVWELGRSDSRIVVRGMRRDDVKFEDAWVSPTGAVFAITTKHLYRLD